MSSLFEHEGRVRRLREALAYMKRVSQAELEATPAIGEGDEWRLFLTELREFAAMAESLGAASVAPSRPAALAPALRLGGGARPALTTLH